MDKREGKGLPAPFRSIEGEEISPEQIEVLKEIQNQAKKDRERKPPALN